MTQSGVFWYRGRGPSLYGWVDPEGRVRVEIACRADQVEKLIAFVQEHLEAPPA